MRERVNDANGLWRDVNPKEGGGGGVDRGGVDGFLVWIDRCNIKFL